MREKYESLGLADLKAIAKARGLKGTSTMKKAELVELMLAEDEKDKAEGKTVQPKGVMEKTSRADAPRTDGKRAERPTGKGERQEIRTDASEGRMEAAVPRERQEARSERTESRLEEPRSEEDKFPAELDSGIAASGILEVMPDG